MELFTDYSLAFLGIFSFLESKYEISDNIGRKYQLTIPYWTATICGGDIILLELYYDLPFVRRKEFWRSRTHCQRQFEVKAGRFLCFDGLCMAISVFGATISGEAFDGQGQ